MRYFAPLFLVASATLTMAVAIPSPLQDIVSVDAPTKISRQIDVGETFMSFLESN